jgi:hypothetical protein
MEPTPTKSLLIPILLSILSSAVVFGTLGYYLATSKTTVPSYTTQSVVTTSPTATPTAVPTASTTENTYTNSEFGFSFTYPKTWSVATTTKPEGAVLALKISDATNRNDTDRPANLTVAVYPTIKKLDTKNLGATSLKDYLDKYAALSDPMYKNVATTTLGTKSGYSADAGPNQFGGGTHYFVTFNSNQIMDVWAFTQDTDTKNILASFTFTK